MPFRVESAAASWTSSSIRASSSSPARGSRSPPGSPPPRSTTPSAAANEIGYPCVVKAQVQIGGRGKAGGIKLAKDETRPREHARTSSGWTSGASRSTRCGSSRRRRSRPSTTPRSSSTARAKKPLIMLSTKGGMDIEAVAEEDPGAIATLHVDPLIGFQDFHGRRLAFEAGVDADVVRPIGAMLAKLYDAFVAEEAMLVEVNPLIVTPEREVRALDAKVTLDGNALFRHPENADAARPPARGPAGADGQGARPHLRQARRRHRHPRQRRRARHVDARRRRASTAASPRTSSTPAAAPRPRRSRRRSRSSSPTRTSRPSCSTSSAASRAATRSRAG